MVAHFDPVPTVCMFCGEEDIDLPNHLPTPEGEGCPHTPMTFSASTSAPSRIEGTERQGRDASHRGSSSAYSAEGCEANPATTL